MPTTASRRRAPSDLAFEIRRSSIQGRGAFATRRIRAGQRVIEYTGQHLTPEEADARYEEDGMDRHHTFLFTLDEDTVVDGASGGSEASFINHSCDPNCEAVIEGRHIYIYAKRTIQPGEELTYDYQYERFSYHTAEDEKFYACRCGAATCRGSILLGKPRRSPPAARKRGTKSGAKKRGTKTERTKSGAGAKKGGRTTKRSTTLAKKGAAAKKGTRGASKRATGAKRAKKAATRAR